MLDDNIILYILYIFFLLIQLGVTVNCLTVLRTNLYGCMLIALSSLYTAETAVACEAPVTLGQLV